jgi:hypothetical protein
VIAGSGGSGLPPGPGLVKGNITALNRTGGEIIWNLETTAVGWVKPGKTPPNGGATAWSDGFLDPDTGILYIPLGSALPNFNASRQTPDLYSNHMVAVNITNGKLIWATPFVAYGTVLDMTVPDTHDWDMSVCVIPLLSLSVFFIHHEYYFVLNIKTIVPLAVTFPMSSMNGMKKDPNKITEVEFQQFFCFYVISKRILPSLSFEDRACIASFTLSSLNFFHTFTFRYLLVAKSITSCNSLLVPPVEPINFICLV